MAKRLREKEFVVSDDLFFDGTDLDEDLLSIEIRNCPLFDDTTLLPRNLEVLKIQGCHITTWSLPTTLKKLYFYDVDGPRINLSRLRNLEVFSAVRSVNVSFDLSKNPVLKRITVIPTDEKVCVKVKSGVAAAPIEYIRTHEKNWKKLKKTFFNEKYYYSNIDNYDDENQGLSYVTHDKMCRHIFQHRCINLNSIFGNLHGWDYHLNLIISSYLVSIVSVLGSDSDSESDSDS